MEQTSPITVLIVDDIRETHENLKKLLYFEKDIKVIGVATSGTQAIEMAKKLTPDVILMDINMPGMLMSIKMTSGVSFLAISIA